MRRTRTWNLVSGILKRRMLQQALGVFDMLFVQVINSMNPFPIIYLKNTNGLQVFLISHRSDDIFCLQCFQVLRLSWWSLTRWCSADHGASDPCCRNQSSEANLFSRYGFGWVTQFLHHQGRYMPREVANENDWPFPATWCYQPNNETVSRLHAISSCMARIYALRMSNVDRLAFLVKIEIVELVKKNSYIIYRLVFDFLSGWRQRLRPWFKTWASCLMRSARLIRLGLRKATLRSNLAYWNSQCVPLMKLYRVVHWSRCASGAICSKILDLNFSYILSNLLIEIRAPPASSIVFWKSEARKFFEAPVWKSENEVPRRPYGLVDVVEYTIYRYLSLKI